MSTGTIVEQFKTVKERNQRRNELLRENKGHVSRHSTVIHTDDGKWVDVWCVSYSKA